MSLILDYIFVASPGKPTSNKYLALINTGAVFTIISHAIAEKERLPKIKRYTAKKWGNGNEYRGWMRQAGIELEGAGRQLRLEVFVPDGCGNTVLGMDYMKLMGFELRIGSKSYLNMDTPDIVTIFPPDVYDYVERITSGNVKKK